MGVDLDLEARLIDAFGLTDAIVSRAAPDPESQRAGVARSAARYLERRLHDGLGGGGEPRSRHRRGPAVFPALPAPIDCVFASAMGGSPSVDEPTNPNEICRALAERSGGRAESLFAPAYVESAEVRDSLLAQEAVAHALQMAAAADMALVGIGGTDDDCTMVRSGCSRSTRSPSSGSRERSATSSATTSTSTGRSSRRLTAAGSWGCRSTTCARIGNVVAVVSGAEKPRAILGVLRAGIIDVLIMDEANARTVLGLVAGRRCVMPVVPTQRDRQPGVRGPLRRGGHQRRQRPDHGGGPRRGRGAARAAHRADLGEDREVGRRRRADGDVACHDRWHHACRWRCTSTTARSAT